MRKKISPLIDDSLTTVDLICSDSRLGRSRVYKIDGVGNVSSVTPPCGRKETSNWYPMGAFCEQRRLPYVEPAPFTPMPLLESSDIPSCSRSPERNPDNNSSDSETAMSGVTKLTSNVEVRLESKRNVSPPPPPENAEPNPTDTYAENRVNKPPSLFNGISGSSFADQISVPKLDLQRMNTKKPEGAYHYEPLDISQYSPTSDLCPPSIASSLDPSRTLTETENAVLNLACDGGLQSIQMHCPPPRHDTPLRYLGFNDITRSPNPAQNHVAELKEP